MSSSTTPMTSTLEALDTVIGGGMRWPLTVMGVGLGWMARWAEAAGGAWREGPADDLTQPRKERHAMKDKDLSGDELKLVRYRLLFTKRELEVAFPEEEHLLTYGTGPAEYGGLRIAEFMGRAAEGKVPQPQRWKDANYPKELAEGEGWTIPEKDRQYVHFYYEVVERIPREKAEYDKEQVAVLREISHKIA